MEDIDRVAVFSDYIREHKDDLLEKYNGQYVVVGYAPKTVWNLNDEIEVTALPTSETALFFGKGKYGYGHFAMQLCTEDEFKPKSLGFLGYTIKGN